MRRSFLVILALALFAMAAHSQVTNFNVVPAPCGTYSTAPMSCVKVPLTDGQQVWLSLYTTGVNVNTGFLSWNDHSPLTAGGEQLLQATVTNTTINAAQTYHSGVKTLTNAPTALTVSFQGITINGRPYIGTGTFTFTYFYYSGGGGRGGGGAGWKYDITGGAFNVQVAAVVAVLPASAAVPPRTLHGGYNAYPAGAERCGPGGGYFYHPRLYSFGGALSYAKYCQEPTWQDPPIFIGFGEYLALLSYMGADLLD